MNDQPPNGGGRSRELLVSQIVIALILAATVALVVLSEDRGLRSIGESRASPPAPQTGFGASASAETPPAVCRGDASSQYAAAVGGLADDCALLLAVSDALAGDASLDWSADAPIGGWEGVIVGGDPPRVVGIDLTASGLSGAIPPQLGSLDALEALHLYGNDLGGGIPPELGNLSNLAILDLGGNRLSGNIPPELGKLERLAWIDLSFNDLSGTIPPEMGDLSALEWLVISGNDLSGDAETALEGMSGLTYLSVYDTQLSGCIPAALSDVDGFLGDLPICGK